MGHLGARVFGDGSCIVLGGQAGAADRELARAGWGFVQLEDDGVTISASAYGPVPGRIQDNDVAELYALLMPLHVAGPGGLEFSLTTSGYMMAFGEGLRPHLSTFFFCFSLLLPLLPTFVSELRNPPTFVLILLPLWILL